MPGLGGLVRLEVGSGALVETQPWEDAALAGANNTESDNTITVIKVACPRAMSDWSGGWSR